jgi:hypothetical protein
MRDDRRSHPYARSVASLLERDGFLGVELEYEAGKRPGFGYSRSPIPFDISYRLIATPRREYIECKYRERNLVTPEEVAKFIADLRLCSIPPERGLVVTNRGYLRRPKEYARLDGLRLYVVPCPSLAGGAVLPHHLAALYQRPLVMARHLLEQLNRQPRLPREFIRIA